MKKLLLILIVLLSGSSLFSQVRGQEIRIVVSPDHKNWDYDLNEKCEFRVQVFKAQNLLDGVSIDYELGAEFYQSEKKQGIVLDNGELTIKSKGLSKPGFLRLDVLAHVDGREYKGSANVSYAKELLQPISTMPADFESFWSNTIKEARKTELNATRTLLPERCTDKVNVYEVSFQNERWGSRIYGILTLPKEEGKYPALLRVPGAGVRPYHGDIETASRGAIVLEIGIHGIPVTMEQGVYDNLAHGALANYWNYGRNNRDESYYKRVFTGALRSVDYICSLPEYNGKALGVTGSSQGGALSIVTAALDDRITFLAAVHPAMCDHLAHTKGRAGGWPHWFYYFKNYTEAEMETSRYYDVANFARNVKVQGWYSWGYNDNVCPPTSMHSAYNVITANKEFHPYLETGHFWYQEQWEEWCKWIWKQMGIE
ncbi:MAG: acetylxylan esterase [Bacteroidales bacterium]